MEKMNATKLYNDFFAVYENAVLDSLCPNIVFSLSGGIDTRVIAGILSKNRIDLPLISWGNKLENAIASKVAKTLGFKSHYFCSVEDLNVHFLRDHGFKYLLSGAFGDEINGSWTGGRAKSQLDFNNSVSFALKIARLKHAGFPIPPECWVTPITDRDVIAFLDTMPFQLRIGKAPQIWILKHKFPQLARIIYYNSLLPIHAPFVFHGVLTMFHYPKNFRNLIRGRLHK